MVRLECRDCGSRFVQRFDEDLEFLELNDWVNLACPSCEGRTCQVIAINGLSRSGCKTKSSESNDKAVSKHFEVDDG